MVFYVTMVTFWMTLLMSKWTYIAMDDGHVHPLAKTLATFNSRWDIVMDDWVLDEQTLGKRQ